jgi:thioredoxin-like negative regulator of GroEL
MTDEKGNGAKAPIPAPSSDRTASTSPSLPPLFRKTDWLTFLITFAAVWLAYYLTLAPEVTLEDSGELATGSFYAGIPHPPGYPVWSIYTWLWTVLLPIKNVAWRVALAEAAGGALATGLLALLVSRGSSLLMEGIEELRSMVGRWESAICMVSGFVAGALLGFNGFMWSQSVIVEVYAFSVANFMVVLVCLMRWIYAPHQRRYLYLALFFHGLCFTNHQTLIVAAMGLEVAIAAADFRLGRYLWLGNSIVYLAGLILNRQGFLTMLTENHAVFVIFNVVGLGSIAAYIWFSFLSKETVLEFCMDACMVGFFLLLAAASAPSLRLLCLALSFLTAIGWAMFAWKVWKLGWEWLVVILCGLCWVAGAAFYFYMPLSGMTNPPMEWGYPRTVEGFFHVLTRGQYGQTTPTDIFHHPDVFAQQLLGLGSGIIEEFNLVYAFLALIPFLFFFKIHRRERAWLIGLTGIYLCLGVLLLILLNPSPDRGAQELNRVFFTSSHTVVSILVGYGLTLISAFMATNYQRFRSWGMLGGLVALMLAIYSFYSVTAETYFGEGASVTSSQFLQLVISTFTNKDQYGLPVYAGLILIGLAVAFVAALYFYRDRAPLAITLGLFALMPLHSILTHWSDNEERDHWFGYWFGHDMFTPPFTGADGKPLYPEMTKDAILFGGTDPGRFCPTYMIFCDSFMPSNCLPAEDPHFDRRDVYIITQNALADGTYLYYIRAQYTRSDQIDPPFFQDLFRTPADHEARYTNALARTVAPLDRFFTRLGDQVEKRRRTYTSWFHDKDFIALPALAARLRPGQQQDPLSKYLYDNCSAETRQLLSGNGDQVRLGRALARDLNVLLERPLYTPGRFKEVELSEYVADFIKQDPQSHTRIRLNRLLLEEAYPKEIAKSIGGVYPDREIYTPMNEDLQQCLQDYVAQAGVKPENGKVQINGQAAVMSINALLTKIIFEHNPKNEFFVEESAPLDWMYPYLTPFGIIMKINRHPLPELTEDIVKRDHEFWSQYSDRLIGNWITYDTSLKDICGWIEKVYLRRDFSGFKGDRKFIRDDQGQKSFSKLRTSIAGVYAWRVNDPGNHNPVAQQRMFKEGDFAFRQAFTFCPYNPETTFRYINFLLSFPQPRFEDALLVASTCLKLDPNNAGVRGVVNNIKNWKKEAASNPVAQSLERQQKLVQENPMNFQAAFDLASMYLQMHMPTKALDTLSQMLNSPHADPAVLRGLLQAYSSINYPEGLKVTVAKLEALAKAEPSNFQAELALAEGYCELQNTNAAVQALDSILASSQADATSVLGVAKQYSTMMDYRRLELSLEKLVKVTPNSPEAWYDLAALKAAFGQSAGALENLRQALDLSAARLRQDPKALDLMLELQKDQRFGPLRQTAEFQELLKPKQ